MNCFTVIGQIVLPYGIIDNGMVCVKDSIISHVGKYDKKAVCGEVRDFSEKLVIPGFVDIHTHAGGEFWGYEDPASVAAHHYAAGTTSMLITLYRDLSHEETMEAIEKIKQALLTSANLMGVHMEGPYINPQRGSKKGIFHPVDRKKYTEIIGTGIVKQWTFAPECDGTEEFLSDILAAGIVPAIGHSEASPAQVFAAADSGARIVTHIMDATGTSIDPPDYKGTLEVSFDSAVLLCNNLFYEIICDSRGIHVRHEHVKLILKTVGVDKIIAVTDCCTGPADNDDLNFADGKLMGSKMTMRHAARNFRHLGLTVPEVMRITAYNPASALYLEKEIGSIKTGCKANLLATDEDFSAIEHIR